MTAQLKRILHLNVSLTNAFKYCMLARVCWDRGWSGAGKLWSTSLRTSSCTRGQAARQCRLKRRVGVVVESPSENRDKQITVTSFSRAVNEIS